MRYASRLFESIFSLVVFLAITLAIGATSYQVFNPDGSIANWLSNIWESDPAILLVIGAVVVMLNRWLGNAQGAGVADLMFYCVVTLGFFYGFKLLMA